MLQALEHQGGLLDQLPGVNNGYQNIGTVADCISIRNYDPASRTYLEAMMGIVWTIVVIILILVVLGFVFRR